MWTEIKGLLVMFQSPQGQAPVDHELGALPLDWIELKPLPKIYVPKKERDVLPPFLNIRSLWLIWRD